MTPHRWRKMARQELESVERFLQERSEQHGPQEPGWFAWQYVDNPDGFDVRISEDGDAIAGVSGFLRCRIEVDGALRSGAFSTNTLVALPYRRQGLGRELHEARLCDYDWALSSGQSPANRQVYEQLGFAVCGDYRRVFVQTTLPDFRFLARALREWWSWLFWRRRRPRPDPTIRVEVEPHAPADPALFAERFEGPAVGPRWGRDHVVWRYEQHPYIDYRFMSVFRRDRRVGFAVVRQSDTAVVLIDLYAAPDDALIVLSGIAGHVRGLITGPFVGRTLDRLFREAGWLTFRAGGQLMGKSNDPTLHGLLSERDWCFFAGDSDTDR